MGENQKNRGADIATFGELLAELRQDRHMTQDQLAKILYVSAGTISNYENNVHFPDVDRLAAMADYFNVTTDYLLGRCSVNVSPDVFEESITPGMTIGALIEEVKALSPERRQALTQVLQDMQLSMMVGQYQKRREK